MTTDKISPDFSVKEWVLCFFKPFEIKRRKRKISRPKKKGAELSPSAKGNSLLEKSAKRAPQKEKNGVIQKSCEKVRFSSLETKNFGACEMSFENWQKPSGRTIRRGK